MTAEKKLRYSRQRERIQRYLVEAESHPSAEMIYEDLRKEIPGLSLGTVYRNLRLLEELGEVRKVANYNDAERYECCCGDHAHFLCTECGCISDVEMDAEALRGLLPQGSGHKLNGVSLTLTGLCPDCAARA